MAYLITFAAAMLHVRLAIAVCVFGAILGCGLFAMICQAAEGRGRFIMLAARLAGYFVVAIGVQIIGMTTIAARRAIRPHGSTTAKRRGAVRAADRGQMRPRNCARQAARAMPRTG